MVETNGCEFCDEINGLDSRFRRHYGASLPSRIITERSGFLAMPSMGQIVDGSIMVLPRTHVERFADLDDATRVLAQSIIRAMGVAIGGAVAVFEHGARARTGGACGIYHAHVHVIPLPPIVQYSDLAEGLSERSLCLSDAWRYLASSNEYLLLSDGFNKTWTRTVSLKDRRRFPSQHFRRVLAKACSSPARWDWREVAQPEYELVVARDTWMTKLRDASFALEAMC